MCDETADEQYLLTHQGNMAYEPDGCPGEHVGGQTQGEWRQTLENRFGAWGPGVGDRVRHSDLVGSLSLYVPPDYLVGSICPAMCSLGALVSPSLYHHHHSHHHH
jgi:hypothetical protein